MLKKLFTAKPKEITTTWESRKNEYARTVVKKGLFSKTSYTSITHK